MTTILLACLAFSCAYADKAPAAPTESRETYEIVLTTAVGVLPDQLKQYVDANLEIIRQSMFSADSTSAESAASTSTTQHHFVKLDVAAKDTDALVRLGVVRAFPRDRKTAKTLFEQHQEKEGGFLPWALEEHVLQMKTAMQEGNLESTLRHIGATIHFSTDAAMPFNTTVDLSGRSMAEKSWCSSESDSSSQLCSLRDRFQRVLFERLRSRLHYEVRVAPDRFRQSDDPLRFIFEVLGESYHALIRVVEHDRAIVEELRINSVDHFQTSVDAYYAHLADRCGPILEERIEAAALLSANLIGTAWVRAGRPVLSTNPAPVAQTEAPGNKGEAAPVAAGGGAEPAPSAKPFAGSVNSTIFHREGCTHLQRVKPENVAYFATLEEAKTAGRTPCKTCKP